MAPIYTIDSLFKQGKLKFSEACKCYRLVREGWTAKEAAAIINNRKLKKEQKKSMKRTKKDNESLEVLKDRLNKKADDRLFRNIAYFTKVCERLGEDYNGHWKSLLDFLIIDDCTPSTDAMNHLDESSCEGLNSSPLVDQDTKELLESNGADSLGMWS